MQTEIWKDIPGYEGLYTASNYGKIKSIKSNKILSPNISTRGYLYLSLYKNKKRVYYTVHRLIIYTFNFIDKKATVNHKDLNKLNNNLDNLEYLSLKENLNHYYSTKKKYFYKYNNKYYPSLLSAYNDIGIYLNCNKPYHFYKMFYNNSISGFITI